MIPQLQATLTEKKAKVRKWLTHQHQILEDEKLQLPVYSSFDLRDAGYKAALVDSNLFPAGFNNLSNNAKTLAAVAMKNHLPKRFSGNHILIIPESHTRNLFYLSNLHSIQLVLENAGYKTTIGTLMENAEDTITVEDSNNHKITLEKIHRKDNKLTTHTFSDGLILLNNDFSNEEPPLLQGVTQTIIPPLSLGWSHRKKSTHFRYFDCLINEFALALDIDPWLLCAIHKEVDNVDFKEPETLEKVAAAVDDLLKEIQQKHDQYSIKEQPYVFVKDNSGTYGMGVLSVSSGDEIRHLNSPSRRKMLFGKQKSKITSVIIQEGVKTAHTSEGHPSEFVIYSTGGKIAGGFSRSHPDKNSETSLNAPGMRFDMLQENYLTKPLITGEGISVYTVLADIANIAIAYEQSALNCEELRKKRKV